MKDPGKLSVFFLNYSKIKNLDEILYNASPNISDFSNIFQSILIYK